MINLFSKQLVDYFCGNCKNNPVHGGKCKLKTLEECYMIDFVKNQVKTISEISSLNGAAHEIILIVKSLRKQPHYMIQSAADWIEQLHHRKDR